MGSPRPRAATAAAAAWRVGRAPQRRHVRLQGPGLRAKLVEYCGDPLLVGPRAAGLRRAAGPELGSARAGWRGVYKRPARLAREVDGKDCQPLCASKVRWALDVGRRRGNDDAVVPAVARWGGRGRHEGWPSRV